MLLINSNIACILCCVNYGHVMFFSDFWQCRKYKASEKIRQKAEFLYHKFKALFLVGEGEFMTKVVQKSKTVKA